MKRILPILLLLALLCGCDDSNSLEQSRDSTGQSTYATQVSTYISNSELEEQTGGAVKQYDLGEQKIDWIVPINGGVLLVTPGEQTVLTTLSGEEGTVTASITISMQLTRDASWQSTPGGFAYYNPHSREVVFLDSQLNRVKTFQMPVEITGNPAISPEGGEIFYCTGQQIYALDTDLNITRPLRTNSCENQTLTGAYLVDTVIACSLQDAQGQWSTAYLSGEDGRTLSTDTHIAQLSSYGNTYLATRMDGTVTQHIYATGDSAPQQLHIEKNVYGALELDGAVSQSAVDNAVQLDFYTLSSGKKTASVSIPQAYAPAMVAADRTSRGVWLLTQENALLYWSLDASAVEEDITYHSPVYTALTPDESGLAKCQERADAMGKTQGIVIRLWQKALVSNDAYDIQPEYQCEAINRALDELETQLEKFPSKFLYKSVAGLIRVCIVRSISGEITSAYHWYDGDPFIILSVGVDMEKAFMDAFAYVLDIHVLGNSSLADYWQELNPAGFAYGSETTPMTYLEGDTRAFADRRAIKSVTDDRASIFYHAMLADNQEMFQSEIMQAKLLRLCQAIRQAWRLTQKPETYQWEQYLNQSLAYQE